MKPMIYTLVSDLNAFRGRSLYISTRDASCNTLKQLNQHESHKISKESATTLQFISLHVYLQQA